MIEFEKNAAINDLYILIIPRRGILYPNAVQKDIALHKSYPLRLAVA